MVADKHTCTCCLPCTTLK